MALYSPIVINQGRLQQADPDADSIQVGGISLNDNKTISIGSASIYYDSGTAELRIGESYNTITGPIYPEAVHLGDNEFLYFGDGNDVSVYFDGTNFYISPPGAGATVQGTIWVDKLRVGPDLTGYVGFAFSVNTDTGGLLLNRTDTTREPFIRLSNSVSSTSGGQIRGILDDGSPATGEGGGMLFTDVDQTSPDPWKIKFGFNGLDLWRGMNTNHLILRGGSGSGATTGRQIQLGFNGSYASSYMHGIVTAHDSGVQVGNRIDFFLWKHGTDASDIDIGTFHTLRLENAAVILPDESTTDPTILSGASACFTKGGDFTVKDADSLISAVKDVYRSMYNDGTSTTVGVAASGTDYEVTAGFVSDTAFQGMTFAGAHYIVATYAGTYRIDWSMAVESSAVGEEIEGGIMIDGAAQAIGTSRTTVPANGQPSVISGTAVIALTATDQISLYVNNISAINDVDVRYGSLSVVRIGE